MGVLKFVGGMIVFPFYFLLQSLTYMLIVPAGLLAAIYGPVFKAYSDYVKIGILRFGIHGESYYNYASSKSATPAKIGRALIGGVVVLVALALLPLAVLATPIIVLLAFTIQALMTIFKQGFAPYIEKGPNLSALGYGATPVTNLALGLGILATWTFSILAFTGVFAPIVNLLALVGVTALLPHLALAGLTLAVGFVGSMLIAGVVLVFEKIVQSIRQHFGIVPEKSDLNKSEVDKLKDDGVTQELTQQQQAKSPEGQELAKLIARSGIHDGASDILKQALETTTQQVEQGFEEKEENEENEEKEVAQNDSQTSSQSHQMDMTQQNAMQKAKEKRHHSDGEKHEQKQKGTNHKQPLKAEEAAMLAKLNPQQAQYPGRTNSDIVWRDGIHALPQMQVQEKRGETDGTDYERPDADNLSQEKFL